MTVANSDSGSEDGCPPEIVRPHIYLVSDVRLYREGLVACLAPQGRLTILGAGGSEDAIDRIAMLRPQVVLLDLAAHDSLNIPHRAKEILPAIKVVAFAVAETEEHVLACAEAGISGYVPQDGSLEDLEAAVVRSLRGELVCPPYIAALLFGRLATMSKGRVDGPMDDRLTPREREVAGLLALNLPNKEIARQLRIGPATIKNHVHNILQKLKIHRRGDIARMRPAVREPRPVLPAVRRELTNGPTPGPRYPVMRTGATGNPTHPVGPTGSPDGWSSTPA
jgi:two-component system, NarL family, nitrate/nitrite response regulator NarL